MNIVKLAPIFLLLAAAAAEAADENFTGKWVVDLRTEEMKKSGVECGNASFTLIQRGENITGAHAFAAAGCGRLNEGGDGTVSGIAVGNTAVLVVTSGRNGAMVLGKATLKGGSLQWESGQELKPSEVLGDSPLILGSGVLKRAGVDGP